jgi:anti-sigma28 factor (negative regulator of flagellin synthesis)
MVIWFEVDTVLAVMFILAGIGFIVFAYKFYKIRDMVVVSIQDMSQMTVLLAYFSKIENPEQKIARMLGMNEAEVKREIEKGNTMVLIERIASKVLAQMKSSVPDVVIPVEKEIVGK